MVDVHGAKRLSPAQAITMPEEINVHVGTTRTLAARPAGVGSGGFFVCRAFDTNRVRLKPGDHANLANAGASVTDGTTNITLVQADGWLVLAAPDQITIDGDAAGSRLEYFWSPGA